MVALLAVITKETLYLRGGSPPPACPKCPNVQKTLTMQAKLFTTAEMEREWAIADVLDAYKQELNWAAKNGKTGELFKLIDPSKVHVKNQHLRDFHTMYPVSFYRTLIPSELL